MAQIALKSLSKSWDDAVAVDDMTLTIEDGEFVAILGPSGCGKSTTLFMLAGIYLPTAGDILFDGTRVNEVEARHRNVGIVFQSYALYPNMSVLQNILFPTRFQTLPEAEKRAREMAEMVQISDLLDRRPSQLSGGQQQRVALARALIKQPNLLLLDEPLSNLDATLRLTMRAEIRRITQELGVTTILVTHDQLEATTMADRVVCMNKGKIEQVGTAEDLYLRPDTRFVAGFIGSPPVNMIDLPHDAITAPPGATQLGIRPEVLRPAAAGIAAEVRHVEPMGREVLTTADTPLGPLRFLEATTQPNWDPGDQLTLQFDPADTVLFDAAGQRIADAKATFQARAVRDPIRRTTEAMVTPSLDDRTAAAAGPREAEDHKRYLTTWECLTSIEVQPAAAAEVPEEITIAAWNIERCKRVPESASLLQQSGADIVLATEMDYGMARSGQHHTTRDLAKALGMGYAFGVEFVELGTGDPFETKHFADVPNEHGLHGNAILSRYPFENPRLLPLNDDGLWFKGTPKNDGQFRIGGRMAMAVQIAGITFVAVHYESESDADGRAYQTRRMLDMIADEYGDGPCVIGGDLNTAGFAAAHLSGEETLANPAAVEPSFTHFTNAGFSWVSSNTVGMTTRAAPGKPVRHPLKKLDWLFARGVTATAPAVWPALSERGDYLSDHELITTRITR
ncbi:MAG: ATP-binding cassette domain-containing protein [Pseudomonadota bacterium]